MLDARRTGLAEGAATLLSSHAEHPRPATSDTTKGSQAHRPTASKRVSSPPVGTLSSASDDTPTTEIETARRMCRVGGRRRAPHGLADWRWFPPAPHRSVHAVLPHTARRRRFTGRHSAGAGWAVAQGRFRSG